MATETNTTTSKATFFSLVSGKTGTKVSEGGKSVTFKKTSVGFMLPDDKHEAFIQAIANSGALTAGEDAHTPTTLVEALQVFMDNFVLPVAEQEEANLALAPSERNPEYAQNKQAIEEWVEFGHITFVVNGVLVTLDDKGNVTGETSQRVKVYINPAREFEGNKQKAGRFNCRVLSEADLIVTAFGSVKTDAKGAIVVNAYGTGPHRMEGDPVYKKREEYRASQGKSLTAKLGEVAHLTSLK